MAHRAFAATLLLAALILLPVRPLAALVLFGATGAVVMNRRRAFGSGMFRAMLAFLSGLWIALLGVAGTLLGLVPVDEVCIADGTCGPGQGNFLLLPGLLLLVGGLAVFGWSMFEARRVRRRRVVGAWGDGERFDPPG
jgi:hypothetical protein